MAGQPLTLGISGETALRAFRDRFNIPISDDQIGAAPFYKPPADSPEMQYLHEVRERLGGYLPARRDDAPPRQADGGAEEVPHGSSRSGVAGLGGNLAVRADVTRRDRLDDGPHRHFRCARRQPEEDAEQQRARERMNPIVN